MARPLRIEFENALYHVTARGIEKKTIFTNVSERQKFLYYLRENIKRYQVVLYAYVLMDNHYHLLVETMLPNLNRFMHDVNTAYSVFHNRRIGRVGPLFQGRYKAIIVDKEPYLLELSRYIHLNPVRAGYLQRAENYRWSSYRVYLGLIKEQWVNCDWIKERFGDRPHARYRSFVTDGLKGRNPFENLSVGVILGSKSFIEGIRDRISIRGWQPEVPSLKELRRRTIDDIVEQTSRHFEVDRTDIFERKRNYLPRKIAMYLARKLTAERIEKIGKEFKVSYHAVSKAVARIEDEIRTNKSMASAVGKIASRL